MVRSIEVIYFFIFKLKLLSLQAQIYTIYIRIADIR
jgi:hypothetical protein